MCVLPRLVVLPKHLHEREKQNGIKGTTFAVLPFSIFSLFFFARQSTDKSTAMQPAKAKGYKKKKKGPRKVC